MRLGRVLVEICSTKFVVWARLRVSEVQYLHLHDVKWKHARPPWTGASGRILLLIFLRIFFPYFSSSRYRIEFELFQLSWSTFARAIYVSFHSLFSFLALGRVLCDINWIIASLRYRIIYTNKWKIKRTRHERLASLTRGIFGMKGDWRRFVLDWMTSIKISVGSQFLPTKPELLVEAFSTANRQWQIKRSLNYWHDHGPPLVTIDCIQFERKIRQNWNVFGFIVFTLWGNCMMFFYKASAIVSSWKRMNKHIYAHLNDYNSRKMTLRKVNE